jgi:hypothetical protein
MAGPSRFAVAKQKILDDLENVIRDVYGPRHALKKHKKRARWNIINPHRHAAKAAQMIVWLTGNRRGAFKDFVSGDTGDGIDLVAFGAEGIIHRDSRMRAVEWAEDRYGLRTLDPETKAKIAAQADKRRKDNEEAAARSQHEQRERCRKMFYACEAKIVGTPVDLYLAARGIPLIDVPQLTSSFRYRADCEYWPLAPVDGEGRRIGKGPDFPALVSAMVSADGKLNALHLTFLAKDGSAKAPVRRIAEERGLDPEEFNEKLFKGDVGGFVIRCTNGPSGLHAENAAAAGVSGYVGITEGIEDALSAAIVEPALRMWAAGSLSGLLHVPDHPCASGWLIFKDNDWGKRQALALFDRAVARIRSFGKPVEVVSMPADWGKDVNDAINNA